MLYTNTRRLPHAIVIQGTLSKIYPVLNSFLGEYGVHITHNRAVHVLSFTRCTIDDARAVSVAARLTHSSALQVIVLAFTTITVEAQHALLKTLEEPGSGTVIVLVTPNVLHLLPTVRSRLVTVTLKFDGGRNVGDAMRFIRMTPLERLTHVSLLVERKDMDAVCEFLDGLLRACDTLAPKEKYTALRVISLAEGYSTDRSASHKQILEHIALTLP